MAPKFKLPELIEAVMLLPKKFYNQEVLATDKTYDVWDSSRTIIVYKVHNFRTKFNPLIVEELEMEGKRYLLFS